MLRHVLVHERTHFRHVDHIWNALRSAALAVHWRNPLVWLAVVLSQRDCELACDKGALKRLGEAERFAYGRTLLALVTAAPRPRDLLRCSTAMTGGGKSVWERVNRIARSPTRWLWAAAKVLAAVLACVSAFGSAAVTEPEQKAGPGLPNALTFSLNEYGTGVLITGLDASVFSQVRCKNDGYLIYYTHGQTALRPCGMDGDAGLFFGGVP